jgi:hypothetical protein
MDGRMTGFEAQLMLCDHLDKLLLAAGCTRDELMTVPPR